MGFYSNRFLRCHNILLLLFVLVSTRISRVESFATGKRVCRQNPGTRSVTNRRECLGVDGAVRTTSTPTESRLYSSDSENDTSSSGGIRFLGRGPDAIVRPGVVLLAPAEEFHHYLRESALFIYSMGIDDNDEYVIRGVIIDNPTPFAIGEMMEVDENSGENSGGIFDNLIYRGGEAGGQEAVFCLHSVDSMGLEEIGTSGVYQGGDLEVINEQEDATKKVKFFFNYMEFLEQELEDMLEITHDDGDAWTSVEISPEAVLDNDCDKSEIWSRLRNFVRGK